MSCRHGSIPTRNVIAQKEIIINVILSMSTQEYKGVTIKKMIHSMCKQ